MHHFLLVAIAAALFTSLLEAKGKHRQRHREREEHRCDDDVVWEGPKNPEELWFGDNDGEFESSRKNDRCKREDEERRNREHKERRR